ncbi:hypothetical protein [Leptospira ilyithenensis]|uniref:Uncharacterized protein n=1 Tax=Leptospira ilyithenensis TaxID=2484901 RepID=A0A4R9LM12_9LEPT|nr:hypothetical protein [Leptospira ilyithenensis]TGN09359.1 hypothetical protein EHS11_12465 [Leptospira ilyithenensis]
MLADRKKEWRLTPSFLQVYVSNLDEVLELALAHGAVIITKPTKEATYIHDTLLEAMKGLASWLCGRSLTHPYLS